MAKEIVKDEIDGVAYQFGQLNPTTSLKLLTKLIKLLGGAMASSGDFMAIVTSLADNIESDQVLEVIKMSLGQTFAIGSGNLAPLNEQFDAHFVQYGTFHLFKVVKKALEVQYGDFFGEKGVLNFTPQKG